MTTETAVVPVEPALPRRYSYEEQRAMAAGPRGKFNEQRRHTYLELRRQGVAHLTAVRRAGISPSTYDRYSAAVGAQWHRTVRYAVEESLDPIRAVRRAAAMEGEPWAVRAEIGDGRAGGASDTAGRPGSTTVNVGTLVVGGEGGVSEALTGLLGRLRERERALGEGDESGSESE